MLDGDAVNETLADVIRSMIPFDLLMCRGVKVVCETIQNPDPMWTPVYFSEPDKEGMVDVLEVLRLPEPDAIVPTK